MSPRGDTDRRFRGKPPTHTGVRPVQRHDARGAYWVFVVRWLDPVTGKKLAETCATPDEALDFLANKRLLARRGALADLDRGRELLDHFATEWIDEWATGHLAERTLLNYAQSYDRLIKPRIGHLELRQLRPKVIDQLKQSLTADGYGAPTVRMALAVLSSMLSQAVVWDRMDSNPVRSVRKPAARRKKVIEPLSVMQIEALLSAHRAIGDVTGEILTALMAYTGARPQDALAVTFDQVTETHVRYDHKVVRGVRVPGAKTGGDKVRTVELLDGLKTILDARAGDGLELLVPQPDGSPWSDTRYRNWTSRKPRGRRADDGTRAGHPGEFVRACRMAGLPESVTPYYLRHTYASLRIAEQRLSLQEIAAELGHSVQVLSDHYSHVISDYRGRGPIDPDALITEARSAASGLYEDSK